MRQRLFTICVAISTMITSTVLNSQEPRKCTDKDLRGAYGFKITGTNLDAGLFALVGRFVADGHGVINGKGTESVNGFILSFPFTAVYLVNSDCTGSAILTFPGGNTAPLQFVIESSGAEVDIIAAGIDGPSDVIETGTAKKQFADEERR